MKTTLTIQVQIEVSDEELTVYAHEYGITDDADDVAADIEGQCTELAYQLIANAQAAA